ALAHAGRCARSRTGLRRAVLRQQRDAQHQTRRIQAKLPTVARWTDFQYAKGSAMSEEKKYWGKYRGTVLNNIDPERRGRLQLSVPDVLTLLPTTFAEPCVPLAGPTGPPMGVYLVPPIGAGV